VDKFGKTYTYSLEYLKEIHSIGMKAWHPSVSSGERKL
jgi:hypothetical protein